MNELKEKNKNSIISYPDIEKDISSTPIEFVTKKTKSKKQKAIIISTSVFGAIVLILLAIVCINLQSNRIFSNIYIDGINVSHLTKEQAISKIEEEKSALSDYKLDLVCQDIKEEISGNDINGKCDIENAVNQAYSIGRFGNIFSNNVDMIKSNFYKTDISCEYIYDEEKLNTIVSSIIDNLPKLEQSSYTIEDNELIITKGKSGVSIDEDSVKQEIVTALHDASQTELQIPVRVIAPDDIDIDKIHKEIYKEPKNATYNKEPFEIVPHQVGVNFSISLEDAQKILEEEKDEYVIPLTYTTPEITTDEIGTEAFPDLLSSFQTTYIQSKVNRTTNLKVASNSINGVVIMPGETFSYNKTLGPRTAEAGYKMAGMYSGGKEVDGLGGGICQISSTLYNIALLANLEIVERHNHQFLPGYVGAGRDATVVYGALDFKFKNNRNYPIKIESSVGNGYVKMKLYGVKEDSDYEVSFSTTILSTIYPKTVYENTNTLPEGQTKVQSYGQNGCTSVTYKILKRNGKEVSREKLSSDTYSAMSKTVLRGTKKTTSNTTTNTNNNNNNNNNNNSSGNSSTNTNNSNTNNSSNTNNTTNNVSNENTQTNNTEESSANTSSNDVIIEI